MFKVVVILILLLQILQCEQLQKVNIGVLALRGEQNVYNKWQETANYLTKNIQGYKFIVLPLDFDQIDAAIEHKKIDFLLANSSIYIAVEKKYQASAIATLKRELYNDQPTPFFGGVIFTKKQSDIKRLEDIKNKSFAAVNETSLGGWHMALGEFLEHHIKPNKDFKSLAFLGTHDKVVLEVLDGKFDAGTVRTGVLESMAKEGKISLDDIQVLDPHQCKGLGVLTTTPCYPEWPLIKMSYTDDELANKVATSLIQLQKDDQANLKATIYGWSVPHNYQAVHDLLKKIKQPPYDHDELTLIAFIKKYWYIALVTLAVVLIPVIVLLYIWSLNKKLKMSKETIQNSYIQLQTMQEKLVESGKMASLGSLVAGVSHEINTPVGMGITGITHILEKNKKLRKLYDDEAMSEEDLFEYMDKIEELGRSIEINLNRAAQLVRSFKQVAVDNSIEEVRVFNFKEYVTEILLSLRNQLKKTKIEVVVDVEEKLMLESYPSAFSQILTNFIINSLKYGYDEGVAGIITISLREEESEYVLRYSDDGKGMAQEILSKIYEPFFTTGRETGGTGLGLHIVYNIVSQMLKGVISCESELNKGTAFTIKFPIHLRMNDG